MNALVKKGEWKVSVRSPLTEDPLNQVVHVWIATERFGDGRLRVAESITFRELEQGVTPREATLQLEPDSAQDLCVALLEAFQQAGVMPWSLDKGWSEATKKHLEDMRRLVFREEE